MNENQSSSAIFVSRSLLRWLSLGIGLVALLVMAVALIVTPASRFTTVSYVSLGVGLAGLAGFVLADPEALSRALTGRPGQYGLTTALMTLFFIAFIVALYVVILKANIAPIDLTEGQEYQLSEDSIELLENLDADVTVTGFFTSEEKSLQDEAEIWLKEYQRYSNGKLTFRFIDPDLEPTEAQRLEISRTGVLVLEQGDRTAEAAAISEREITGALVRVLIGEERVLYATTGHGERDVDGFLGTDLSQIKRELTRLNFVVRPLNILEEGGIPEDAAVVLIAGPTASFTPAEVEALKAYLDGGGAVMLLSEPGRGGSALSFGVLDVGFSRDGTRIASAGADGTARIWDTQTGEELLVMRGHNSDVLAVAFSPDGSRLVTAGLDNTIRVWDTATGEEITQLSGLTETVRRIVFSPDGRLLASASEIGAVNVWDAATLEPLPYSPIVANEPLLTLAFSPDSRLIASAGESPVYIWDAATGEVKVNERLHSSAVLGLAFSPDGSTLYTVDVAGYEGTLVVETGEGSTVPRFPDLGISGLAVAANGSLAYAVGDGTIHIRPLGSTDASTDVVLKGINDFVWQIAFSPDGQRLVSASRDGNVVVWDTAEGTQLLELAGHTTADELLTYLKENWAINLQDDLVIDLLSQEGEMSALGLSVDAQSPITAPLLESRQPPFFPSARSIDYADVQGSPVTHVDLLRTANMGNQMTSWGETNPASSMQFDADDVPGPLTLAVSAENSLTGARLVVVGDADFASNDALQKATYGNAEFFLNAANWLAGEGEELDLPAPDFDTRMLDRPYGTVELSLVIISITCLLPLVLAAGGIGVWIVRRRRH